MPLKATSTAVTRAGDKHHPKEERYYRLKQLYQDGTFSYSPVYTLGFASSPNHSLTVFPNPAHGVAALTGAQPGAAVKVFDVLGREVSHATADANGTAALALPAGTPAGVYLCARRYQSHPAHCGVGSPN